MSHCALLRKVEGRSLTQLPLLQALSLAHNSALTYFSPSATADLESLRSLDISNNNLTSLEDMSPFIHSLENIRIGGNNFVCHCSLAWLQALLLQKNKIQVTKGKDIFKDWNRFISTYYIFTFLGKRFLAFYTFSNRGSSR